VSRRLVDNIRDAPVIVARPGDLKLESYASVESISTLVPNDPGYDPAWGNILGLPFLLAELQQQTGLKTVYIVVMDTGITPHPDLDANRATQYDRDFTGSPSPDPAFSTHGQNVASIAVTRTNNGIGAASIAGYTGTVKVIDVRIFDVNDTTSVQAEVDALNYVASLVDQGVPIVAVTCAFGGPGEVPPERDAINALTNRGVVVFAAAGIGPDGGHDFHPAAYAVTNPLVVPVTALNAAGDGLSSPNGWGTIAAPTNVRVLAKASEPNWVGIFGGLSASVGQPAAAYALISSLFPGLSPADRLRRLVFSASPLNGAAPRRLNAYLAGTKHVFLVGSQGPTTGAAVLDALSSIAGPFAVHSRYFTSGFTVDEPTRVAFFAYNLDLTTSLSSLRVKAVGLQGKEYTLPIADPLATMPNEPFVTKVTVTLPDELAGKGNLIVTFIVNGTETNGVSITIR